nr:MULTISPECIES: hypothetical protein [unclassified Anabaena]
MNISHDDLRELTNLPVNNKLIIITDKIQQFSQNLLRKAQGTESATVVFVGLSISVFTYLLVDIVVKLFFNNLTIPSWLLLIIFSLWIGGTIQTLWYLIWQHKSKILKKNITNSLRILLNDVERYNSVIKAIDINDQIEEAGNLQVGIEGREKVIEALKLTKEDLIRALKTEKILRENKNFIITNSNLFANNLAALASMQVTEEATEHSRLLNEALQISLDVQQEMKSLKNKS